jgi:anti-sigma B factor antagonist
MEELMRISMNEKSGVAVLTVSGRLMGGKDADRFHDRVREILDDGHRNILVDLSNVSWVNSTGLGILIAAHSTVSNASGAMKLCQVNKRVESLLMVTRLNMIFETYDDESQALASF